MIFPFTAIVGQEDMKLGLILNVIDPTIGGLLIAGEKGTGKSTAVRALAELLPEIEVVKGRAAASTATPPPRGFAPTARNGSSGERPWRPRGKR